MDALQLANSAFAVELFKQLCDKEQTGNVLFSPICLSTSLSLAQVGAKGDTESEIGQVRPSSSPSQPYPVSFWFFDCRVVEHMKKKNETWERFSPELLHQQNCFFKLYYLALTFLVLSFLYHFLALFSSPFLFLVLLSYIFSSLFLFLFSSSIYA